MSMEKVPGPIDPSVEAVLQNLAKTPRVQKAL